MDPEGEGRDPGLSSVFCKDKDDHKHLVTRGKTALNVNLIDDIATSVAQSEFRIFWFRKISIKIDKKPR